MSFVMLQSLRSRRGSARTLHKSRVGRREILYSNARGDRLFPEGRQSSHEEHVVTPHGPRPRSLVHTLEEGHRLKRTAAGFQKIDAAGHVLKDIPVATFRSDIIAGPSDGWVVFANWTNSGSAAVSCYSATWEVPAPPRTDSGQTIFLFSAIEDGGRDNILQPVLQWGASQAGGGSFWSVSSWYVDPTGIAIHTTPVPVQPGEILTGVMSAEPAGAGKFTYTCRFVGKDATTLVVPEIPELVWYSATLEAYDIVDRSHYPDTSQTVFSSTAITVTPPDTPVNWLPMTRSSAFGETISIVTNGAAAAEIAIGYGNGAPAVAAAPLSIGSRAGQPAQRRPLTWSRVLGSGAVFLVLVGALYASAALVAAHADKSTLAKWWGAVLVEMTAIVVIAGVIAKKRVLGALIDDRNRMSLARFQILTWTLLILSAYFVMAACNIKHGFSLPTIQQDLWLVLGITNAAGVASALVLNPKRTYTRNVALNRVPASDTTAGSLLDVRDSPARASWTDLFFGEEASNRDTVDISRLQQFTFTLVLLFAFVAKLLDALGAFTGGALNMPDLDASAIGLLGLSNTAYLLAKQTAKPPVTPQ